jgi:hypothetical protein
MSTPMAPRNCVECKHWKFSPGSPDWSEVTPGEAWGSWCECGHWQADDSDTENSWRTKLRMARECNDFEQAG